MVKRFVPAAPFSVRDRNGHKRIFTPDFTRRDGTLGYTEDEIKALYKAHRGSFQEIEVSGYSVEEEVVERATAAPGEKRQVAKKKTDDDE